MAKGRKKNFGTSTGYVAIKIYPQCISNKNQDPEVFKKLSDVGLFPNPCGNVTEKFLIY